MDSNNTKIYITKPHSKAREKLGEKIDVYFCIFENKAFKTMEEVNEYCKKCYWSCDRATYLYQKHHNLRGLNMKPLSDYDPLIKIEGHFMPLDERDKIRREIIEDNEQDTQDNT